MCRLFGTISTSEIDAAYLLEGADQSLLYQSHVSRKQLQKDGWGIGWFEKGRPVVVKSSKAIYNDQTQLRRAARQARGNVLLGHVRWSSNPMKLPKKELIGIRHSQPFAYKRWIFAHNGTLLIPREARAALGSLAKRIQGNNDSEVLFYWLMNHLKSGSNAQIVQGIRRSLSNLDAIWQTCRKKYPLYKYPYHGLNWVLSDSKMLIAMCYVNSGGFGKAKALSDGRQPYYQLQLSVTSQEVCVASEPLDPGRLWRAIRHGDIVIARRMKRSIKMATYRVGLIP